MTSYLNIMKIADDTDFQKRVKFALFVSAQAIKSEDQNTVDHSSRLTWANAVFNGSLITSLQEIVYLVLTNATIQISGLEATDGDIQYQMNSLVTNLVSLG